MSKAGLTLHPSEIARYFELDKCPKYVFWLSRKNELEKSSENLDEKIKKRLKGEIDKVLRKHGKNFEKAQQRILARISQISEVRDNSSFDELVDYIINKRGCNKEACIFTQPSLEGTIGIYVIEGRADIVLVRHSGQKTEIWVFEAKFTNQEKFHHRLQAIIYAKLIYDAVHKQIQEQGRSLEIYVSVLTKKNNLELGLDKIKKLRFPDETRTYVEILESTLKKDGIFDKILTGEETPRFWISKRCQGCPYEAFCIKEAVEKKGLELLGIRPGDQEILEEIGIRSLEDLADLYEYPEKFYPAGREGFKHFRPKPGKEDIINTVLNKLNISNLQKLAQGAYRLVRELNCNPDNFSDWIQGSGYNLPRDIYDETQLRRKGISPPGYPSGSLIRVYIFVQHDPIHDRVVLLSATVDNTLTGKSRNISELIHIPIEKLSNSQYRDFEDKILDFFEKELLENFFKKLIWAINDIKPQLPGDQCYIHLYFYSKFQRFKFMDAIRRHKKLYGYKPIRWLLGLRKEIDQEMVSILKDEITKRHALRFPGLGIIPVVAHYYWNGNDYYWNNEYNGWFRWDPDIKSEFEELFRIGAAKKCSDNNDDNDIHLDLARVEDIFPNGTARIPSWIYPVINREIEQIPLEYIWKLTTSKSGRIKLEKLAINLALAIRHIERSIPEWSKDVTIPKEPIPADALETLGFENISLAEVLIEYQKLEYQAKKEQLFEHYRLSTLERTNTDKSVRLKVVEIKTDETSNIIISGKIVSPEGDLYNLDSGSPLSLSEGSWVVITPIDRSGREIWPYSFPESKRMSILSSILRIRETYDSVTMDLLVYKISKTPWNRDSLYFVEKHPQSFKVRGNSIIITDTYHPLYGTQISKEQDIIIDEALDNIVMSYSHKYLLNILRLEQTPEQLAHFNPIYYVLANIYTNSSKITKSFMNSILLPSKWNPKDVVEFVKKLERSGKHPNRSQKRFIHDISRKIVLLQGPPGTGKTSSAIAPAVLSRAYSAIKNKKKQMFFVTAISHTAINEALKKIISLKKELANPNLDKNFTTALNNIHIYRLVNSEYQRNILIERELRGYEDYIEFINYKSERDVDKILHKYLVAGKKRRKKSKSKYHDLESFITGFSEIPIFFGTPGAMKKFFEELSEKLPKEDSFLKDSKEFVDLLVIDEASMMDLPTFFLVTSFLKENGQILLVGDHRQMQPIQQHDWEHEDRETIEQHTPFLSAINFIRFLRGELSGLEREEFKKVLYRDPPSWECDKLKDVILPFHRLDETYRLPQVSADMHTDLFYKYDGIRLKSKKEDSPRFREMLSEHINSELKGRPCANALFPEYPITLILHNENKSTKINEVEKLIIAELIRNLPEEYTAQDKLGIVVPFKAQRAQIKSLLRGLGLEHVQVDTVERFQGGEKDIIIISLTASDPSYISAVLEFLFNPNRLNVAMSRMKEKLILIGSQEVFNATTTDVQKFEELIEPWRALFRKIRTYGEELWRGTLEDFVREMDTDNNGYQKTLEKYKETNIEIFGINKWPKRP
ncbi:AAA domain-containing protein [Thermococcus sp.]|uniref:AAA domain-containing protein n=1 Tax=Thermococcus sp. TaxID=35749 RepID=UPI00260264A7|nr:AAA domain-containing protein [Thermococcus sp.]